MTFRLADSVPQEKIRRWHAEKTQFIRDGEDAQKVGKHVQRQIERWLDRGLGQCVLEDTAIGEVVEKSLRYYDGEYVVMPNHVHVLVHPLPGHELSHIAHSWKSFTAHEINKMLGRAGALWQREAFDHIVRDTAALMRFRRYIRDNPKKLPGRRAHQGRGKFAEVTGL